LCSSDAQQKNTPVTQNVPNPLPNVIDNVLNNTVSGIVGFNVTGTPSKADSIAGSMNVISNFTGVFSYIADVENLVPGAAGTLNRTSMLTGYVATLPTVYKAFENPSIDSVSTAAGRVAGVTAGFPLGLIAGPSTEMTVKSIGKTAEFFNNVNNMLRYKTMESYEAMFNFAARYK
jgi:hypothetical protein